MIKSSVTIIICTRDRAEHLEQTLRAIASLNVPGELSTELLVVDNASTDNTKAVVCECNIPSMSVRYIYEPQSGLSNARNTGIANANGYIILFTDDDVRPPQDWIAGMCEPILSGRAQAVAGGIKMAPHLRRDWMQKVHTTWLAAVEYESNKSGALIGANMAISSEVLEKVPAFDTQLGAGASGFGEDTLFSEQLKVAGYKIVFSPNTVEHYFDEKRLSRQSFLTAAVKRGNTGAYFAYHWVHNPVTLPLLREWKHIFELTWLRFINFREMHRDEGPPVWELNLLQEIHFFRQYRTERKHPRNYEAFGLMKLAVE